MMRDSLWSCRALLLTCVCAAALYGGPLLPVCEAQEEGALRLQDGPADSTEGRLEIYHAGQWGTVCDSRDAFGAVDARVACRQLGYATGTVADDIFAGSGPIWLDEVGCTGEEERLTACAHSDWGARECLHYQDVGVSCADFSLSVEPAALAEGQSATLTVTDLHAVPSADNRTITLAFGGSAAADDFTVATSGGQLLTAPYTLTLPAGHSTVTATITTADDSAPENVETIRVTAGHAGLTISTTTVTIQEEGALRLQGEEGFAEGRLEIYHAGQWGTVCEDGFEAVDARVACRQLGYATGTLADDIFAGSGPIWLDEVGCTGEEERLAACAHSGWGVSPCDHDEDVGVSCPDFSLSVAPTVLTEGQSAAVTVTAVNGVSFADDRTITLIFETDPFSMDADDFTVATGGGQLLPTHYPLATFYTFTLPAGQSTATATLTAVDDSAKENAETITFTVYAGEQLGTATVTILTSDPDPRDIPLRLQDGPTDLKGRLEVYYDGQWGTVCYDGFGALDAQVACRQLGYAGGTIYPQAPRSAESTPIWLGHVGCTGEEEYLAACRHLGWGRPHCNHPKEDVGISCDLRDDVPPPDGDNSDEGDDAGDDDTDTPGTPGTPGNPGTTDNKGDTGTTNNTGTTDTSDPGDGPGGGPSGGPGGGATPRDDTTPAPPTGSLENPGPNSFQSGIGLIAGWVCEAEAVEIEIASEAGDTQRLEAAYGTARGDTAVQPDGTPLCGDTDNGFGLLFNWNLLGDGEHTVVAVVDGVELGRATVTVTTLGEEFVEEAAGACVVEDFPRPGETVTLAWQEPNQNFVMTSGTRPAGENRAGIAGIGSLENPGPNSFQSGIGLISGWVCEAEAVEIEMETAGGAVHRFEAAYGTERADTAVQRKDGTPLCGDTDNGFGLLFNWNLLGAGEHTVVAVVDGVELDRATVTVTTLGAEFLEGAAGECVVEDFPLLGETVTLEWQQTSQNFVITDLE